MENIMLETIKTKINSIFSKIFLLILAASFALWGVGDIFSSNNNSSVANVGNLQVTADDYIKTYQRIISDLNKNTNGQITEDIAKSLGVPRQTLGQLINEKLIDIEVNKAKINVPDDYLRNLIYSSDVFKDQFGAFSKQQFEYVIRQLGMDEATYFNEIRKAVLREQIKSPFTYGNDLSPIFDKIFYDIRNEKRNFQVVSFSSSSIKIDKNPSEADINNKLNNDENLYQKPEYRSFSFISIKPEDLLEKIIVNEADLKSEYNNFPDKYNTPEKRDVILANFKNKEEANNILKKMDSNTTNTNISENFIQLIKDNTNQTSDTIELGYIKYSDFPSEVTESIFKAELNKIIGPEETVFGWRIFLVREITQETSNSYEDVKPKIEKELKVNIALDKMYELGNIFYDEIAAGNEIDQAALSIGAKVEKFINININGVDITGNVVNNLPPYPGLLETVFASNLDEASELVNTISNTMYAIQVNEILEKRTMTIDEAREKIISDLNLEKSLNITLKNANNFSREANSDNFNQLAKKYNLIVLDANDVSKDGSGAEGILDAETLKEAFNIKKGKTSKPLKYNDKTYVVVNVKEIIPVKERNNSILEKVNLEISQSISRDLEQLFIKNLTNNQKIKINENLLNSLFQNDS
jgi:peptidyl-prolyl cis-trans isomerase D